MLKLHTVAVIVFAPMAFSATADMTTRNFQWDQVTAGVNLGALSGQTHERVYSPATGRKVSQLDWRYDNAAVVQGSLEWDAFSWLSLGASGWTTLARKGGQMDDYDWTNAAQKTWTDHSSHPNTNLNFANQFDLHAKGWIFNQPSWRLGLMAGYQESRFSFNSHGGSYRYNNGANVGSFDADTTVIGYKQRYSIPYVGLTGLYRYGDIEFASTFKYSAWAKATGNDEHYLRDLTFTSKTRNQDFFSLAASVGYYVTEHAKVYLEGTWNRTTNETTDLTARNYNSNTAATYRDASGIESNSFMTTAGLKYTF